MILRLRHCSIEESSEAMTQSFNDSISQLFLAQDGQWPLAENPERAEEANGEGEQDGECQAAGQDAWLERPGQVEYERQDQPGESARENNPDQASRRAEERVLGRE